MKKLLFTVFIISGLSAAQAQVRWSDSLYTNAGVDWNNYSTSYIGDETTRTPILVTAIPYDGIYNMRDRSAMDMDFAGSAFRFRSNLEDRYRKLFTYSKSSVYFMAPGIFRSNAAAYEFRVMKDDSSVIKPWSDITQFVDDDFGLNNFPRRFAFIGGFVTDWDHYLVVELRKKGSAALTSAAVVYWKQASPEIINIFTSIELNELLLRAKSPFDLSALSAIPGRWKKYKPEEIDSSSYLPKKLILEPQENNLTFVLSADIYKKEALIYSVTKDGGIYRKAAFNDNDNNLISLRDLSPGSYTLEMKYAAQPQKIVFYHFVIKKPWYKQVGIQMIGVALIIASFLAFFLWWSLKRQQKRTAAELEKRERLQLGLKTIHSQLNPHFIFNALSSIQGLINNNDINAANRYLSDFGTLIRHALTDSNRELIPLEREISTLDKYLKLEKLRFNFGYEIFLDERINAAATELPSLLLQPLVENAVRHGISGMNEHGSISVRITKQEDNMEISLDDNGRGFDATQTASGFGLKLTNDRIHLLNEMMPDTHINFSITSNAGKGTQIRLLFQNWLRQ